MLHLKSKKFPPSPLLSRRDIFPYQQLSLLFFNLNSSIPLFYDYYTQKCAPISFPRDITMGVLLRTRKAILEGGYGGHPPAVIWLAPLHPQNFCVFVVFFSHFFALFCLFLSFFVFFSRFWDPYPLRPAEPFPPLGGAGGVPPQGVYTPSVIPLMTIVFSMN